MSFNSWAVGAVTAKFYKSPAGQETPSREGSKEKSPEKVESVSSNLGKVSIQKEAPKEDNKKDDGWDITGDDGWGDVEEKSETKTSEGWDDDEDWGSLEDTKTSSKVSPPSEWEAGGGLNMGVKTHGAFADIKPSTESSSAGWDDWGNSNTEESKDEARKRREEKRLERQKEIEAKRAAKKGPMKLGGKKMLD